MVNARRFHDYSNGEAGMEVGEQWWVENKADIGFKRGLKWGEEHVKDLGTHRKRHWGQGWEAEEGRSKTSRNDIGRLSPSLRSTGHILCQWWRVIGSGGVWKRRIPRNRSTWSWGKEWISHSVSYVDSSWNVVSIQTCSLQRCNHHHSESNDFGMFGRGNIELSQDHGNLLPTTRQKWWKDVSLREILSAFRRRVPRTVAATSE